jgi:hypothetical protein
MTDTMSTSCLHVTFLGKRWWIWGTASKRVSSLRLLETITMGKRDHAIGGSSILIMFIIFHLDSEGEIILLVVVQLTKMSNRDQSKEGQWILQFLQNLICQKYRLDQITHLGIICVVFLIGNYELWNPHNGSFRSKSNATSPPVNRVLLSLLTLLSPFFFDLFLFLSFLVSI